MGTNLAPTLANLYLVISQEELKKKCTHDFKLTMDLVSWRVQRKMSNNGLLVIM